MNETAKKNKRIIVRLSRYKNVLYRFREQGFEKIYSEFLAEEVGITASQVRKDFSIFGLTGNKRAGYKISELMEHLEQIFHKDRVQKVVIVGAGRLGSALTHYRGFERERIQIIAAFDIDPKKFQHEHTVPVLPLEELESFIQKEEVEIAILAVPERVAQETFERLAKTGIKGVLNCAPIPVKAVPSCLVSTYCVEVELENIIYFVNKAKEQDADHA